MSPGVTDTRPINEPREPIGTAMPAASAAGDERQRLRLIRGGIIAVFIYQTLNWLFVVYFTPDLSKPLAPIFEFLSAVTAAALWSTWRGWYRRRWRLMMFAYNAILVAMACASAIISHGQIIFFIALLLLCLGSAIVVQWGPYFQCGFSTLCLAAIGVISIVIPDQGVMLLFQWVALGIAAALAQFAVTLNEGDRRRREALMRAIRDNEAELVAARQAAEAASRAKSEFLSQMSHDIRTPMNSILGMAELLNETQLAREQREYLSVMMNNGADLLELINKILDLARIESGRLTLEAANFNLAELAQNAVETIAAKARQKGLKLTLRIAPDVPAIVNGDSLRVRQILINLLGNALKFTERGEIALDISRAGNDPRSLHLRVADTGIGVPADQQGLIFNSYSQAQSSTARQYGGSGLGLAIVKQLTELMGGGIWLESEVGHGSAFHLTIPLDAALPEAHPMREPAPAPAALAPESGAASETGRRILIVDDSADNRMLLDAFLRRSGYTLEFAENGDIAYQKFVGSQFDAVLMDIQMPVRDGYETTRMIRAWENEQRRRRTPIIALTASVFGDAVRKSLEAGCDAHVSKPVKRSTLLQALQNILSDVPARRDHSEEQESDQSAAAVFGEGL